MQRWLLFVAAAVLSASASAQSDRDYYREQGTTLPRALSSSPVTPQSSSSTNSITAPGSNVNMSPQARRDLDTRWSPSLPSVKITSRCGASLRSNSTFQPQKCQSRTRRNNPCSALAERWLNQPPFKPSSISPYYATPPQSR